MAPKLEGVMCAAYPGAGTPLMRGRRDPLRRQTALPLPAIQRKDKTPKSATETHLHLAVVPQRARCPRLARSTRRATPAQAQSREPRVDRLCWCWCWCRDVSRRAVGGREPRLDRVEVVRRDDRLRVEEREVGVQAAEDVVQ